MFRKTKYYNRLRQWEIGLKTGTLNGQHSEFIGKSASFSCQYLGNHSSLTSDFKLKDISRFSRYANVFSRNNIMYWCTLYSMFIVFIINFFI